MKADFCISYSNCPPMVMAPFAIRTLAHCSMWTRVVLLALWAFLLPATSLAAPESPETRRSNPESASALPVKPTLYFLGIGTGEFAQPAVVPPLQFVDDDVRGMHAWALDQKGKVFGEVVTEVLIGSRATRANILASLSSFGRKDSAGQPVSREDLVVVYFAGHGVVDTTDNTFYLLTWDLQSTDVRNNALASTDLIARLMEDSGDKRSVLLLLDTCQSGAVVNRTFQQFVRTPSNGREVERGVSMPAPLQQPGPLLSTASTPKNVTIDVGSAPTRAAPRRTPAAAPPPAPLPPQASEPMPPESSLPPLDGRGVGGSSPAIELVRSQADPRQLWAVFSATSELQKAREGSRYRYEWELPDIEGHGVFTWALLGALRSVRADLNRDGRITLQELEKDVLTQVRSIGGQQPDLAGKLADRELAYARGAPEECDGKDNNFNGLIDEGFADRDKDGQADCLRSELCNGVDDNGNGIVDEGYDFDNDGFLNRNLCPAGIGQDCNDRDPAISPIAQDRAERQIRWITDNNCNSIFDEDDVKLRWDPNVPDFIEAHARYNRFKRDLSAASTLTLAIAAGTTVGILSQAQARIAQDSIYDVSEGDIRRVKRLSWASSLLAGATGLSMGITVRFTWFDNHFRMKYYPRPGN